MKVMKFGGTSVGKPERMHEVARLVNKDVPTIVVLSALSGTTNALVAIGERLAASDRDGAKKKINELHQHYLQFIPSLLREERFRTMANDAIGEHFDFLNIILRISFSESLNRDILAQGELMSTKLFCIYLEQEGVPHKLLPALDFMQLDTHNEPDLPMIREKIRRILSEHSALNLFVTQGYICRNAKGEVDNLKRGGSDYSASLIGAAVEASVCEIWTDISGMHNNDPRVVQQTKPISRLSFDEAAELAYFGAKILHPASIWPAQQFNVPVRLLNTMDPTAEGTLITEQAEGEGVKAVAAKDGITAINVRSSRMLLAYGFLRRVFEVFEKYRTPIDMITTSEVAVSLTIDNIDELNSIQTELSAFSLVEVDHDQTIISVVGNRIAAGGKVLQDLFQSLGDLKVRMVSYGGSEHNISLLLRREDKDEALRRLNRGIFGLN